MALAVTLRVRERVSSLVGVLLRLRVDLPDRGRKQARSTALRR
jgi:hypothetical protein